MSSTTSALKGVMRALQLEKPNSLSLKSLAIPQPPANHVLIQIHASAIQPSDIANVHGGFADTTFPRVMGRDFSGTIAAVGEGSPSSLVGKAVYGTSGKTHAFTVDGFQAEYAVVPVAGFASKPEGLTHVQAATLGVPISTAALIVKRATVSKGERILVLGAKGAVGSAVCAILGNEVSILKGVRGSGGDVDTAADPELKAAGHVDVVIDTVGSPSMTEASISILSPGGRLVFITAPKDVDTPKLTVHMKDFYRQDLSLLGVNSVSRSIEDMATVLQGVDESTLVAYAKANSNWTEVGLDEAAAAYENKTRGKKFVIKMQ